MPKEYSGWNPETRQEVEQLIVKTLMRESRLTIKEVRADIFRHNHLRKNLPLTHRSLSQLCRSLRLRGVLSYEGKPFKAKRWSLADKAT